MKYNTALMLAVMAISSHFTQIKAQQMSLDPGKVDPKTAIDEINRNAPIVIEINLSSQKIKATTPTGQTLEGLCSTGKTGHDDYPDQTSIIGYERVRNSSEFPGSVMTSYMRLDIDNDKGENRGVGIHGSGAVVPRWNMSHGCIRLTDEFAAKLARMVAPDGKPLPNKVIFVGSSPA